MSLERAILEAVHSLSPDKQREILRFPCLSHNADPLPRSVFSASESVGFRDGSAAPQRRCVRESDGPKPGTFVKPRKTSYPGIGALCRHRS